MNSIICPVVVGRGAGWERHCANGIYHCIIYQQTSTRYTRKCNEVYPLVLKRGNWKSTRNGGFNWKITELNSDTVGQICMGYPPVVKHGWLENGPLISDFRFITPPFTSGIFQLAMVDETGGYRIFPAIPFEEISPAMF